MRRSKIVIIDFGLGNQSSIRRTVESLGYKCVVSSDAKVIAASEQLILPGVGAFPVAMDHIQKTGLGESIINAAEDKKRILGICLGMQLLTEGSSEFEFTRGLSLIPGTVKQLSTTKCHIGWNTVSFERSASTKYSFKDAHFYFNHSFVFDGPKEYCIANTEHKERIPAIIKKKNIIGMQFHPEKSQEHGREILSLVLRGKLDA